MFCVKNKKENLYVKFERYASDMTIITTPELVVSMDSASKFNSKSIISEILKETERCTNQSSEIYEVIDCEEEEKHLQQEEDLKNISMLVHTLAKLKEPKNENEKALKEQIEKALNKKEYEQYAEAIKEMKTKENI